MIPKIHSTVEIRKRLKTDRGKPFTFVKSFSEIHPYSALRRESVIIFQASLSLSIFIRHPLKRKLFSRCCYLLSCRGKLRGEFTQSFGFHPGGSPGSVRLMSSADPSPSRLRRLDVQTIPALVGIMSRNGWPPCRTDTGPRYTYDVNETGHYSKRWFLKIMQTSHIDNLHCTFRMDPM